MLNRIPIGLSRPPVVVLAALVMVAAATACKSSSSADHAMSKASRMAPGMPRDRARPAPRPATELEFVGGYYQKPKIDTHKAADGTIVMLRLKRVVKKRLPGGQVPFTAEPYTLTLDVPGRVAKEADLFGTGLRMDLDGDGAFTGALPVSCAKDGTARVGETVLGSLFRPSSQQMPDLDYAVGTQGGPVRRIGPKGAHVVVFQCSPTGRVSFGISAPDRPFGVTHVVSPALRLLLAEKIDGPGTSMSASLVDIRVNAKRVSARLHESRLYGGILSRAKWEAVRWTLFPLDPKAEELAVTLTIRGLKPKTPAALVMLLNTSHGKTGRRRHLVGFVPLGR